MGTRSTTPLMEFSGVALRFPGPPAVDALRPTSLAVVPGEYLSVIGPSGSGKSSMLNIMGMLERPSEGVYRFEGQDVAGLDERSRSAFRASRVGFVFQAFHLILSRTALENVMLAAMIKGRPSRSRRREAEDALETVGLGHRMHARSATLSGGEKQRVAVARALIGDVSLLLCDEPTGNLDSETSVQILELLEEQHREGRAIVLVTHDLALAERAERSVTMRDGRIDNDSVS